MYLSVCCGAISISLQTENQDPHYMFDLYIPIMGMCSECLKWDEFFYNENYNFELENEEEE